MDTTGTVTATTTDEHSGAFTLENLKRILREGAGADESVDFDGDILDTDFEELGYESLALLETCGRIEREYGITLDDSVVGDVRTPRRMVEVVNEHLDRVTPA
ncbi:acyl carrier protein [Streptomyces bacillaris]|uniref:acyl carrier protein n=1 Tax=Streptomyces TaxID=1883 RepID=UPI0006AD2428|nr:MULTISPECIES: acyl carrier protein [Streptomyces]ALC28485.1 actinorhodin polyketide synthase acyl carrier protein [Streptomyces sp. CFMR 7]ATY97165.1 acyl carrier protein [Streptomyces cavourensis]MBH0243639.1 acyl carrier protein [Streptomyces cavourensis]MBT3076632.1 acyl carrier protein [Streptomyces sp. COG21]MBT3078851.1 acyl carrier protein [Streptomyces sp. COG20]